MRSPHYLKEHKIPLITGKLYKILSQAYYGGHVDMYLPSNQSFLTEGWTGSAESNSILNYIKNIGKNVITRIMKIFHYDINSLFPTGMKLLNFPTGKIYHFIPRNNEALSLISKEYKIGIFRVNLQCPNDLMHPIIPIKIDHACVYPTGNWSGWYHAEELKNALKYGYKFEVLEGYFFEDKPIFKDYIEKLYEIKQNSKPNTPHYIISKLLVNSIYGRFAALPFEDGKGES